MCNEKSIGIGTEFISSKDASPSNKIRSNKVRSTWHEPVVTSNRFDLLNDEKSVSPKSTYSKDSYDIANVRSNSGTGIRNGNKEKLERIINDRSQKKNVLIIGNSHTNSLDPDKVSSQHNVQKVTAFTISEADVVISTFEGDSVPDCIVFHLIVNDIKHMEADECVRSMCSLVDKTMKKFNLCKIVLSHAPNRKDSEVLNNRVDVVNCQLKAIYHDHQAVKCCNNGNLSNAFGNIKDKFIARDGKHLSLEGGKMLYSNLRYAIESTLGLEHRRRPRVTSRKDRVDLSRPFHKRYHSSSGGGYPFRGNIFVKNHITKGITFIRGSNSEYCWLKLCKSFFNLRNNVFIAFVYNSPINSTYTKKQDADVLECIEYDLVNYQCEGNVMLLGDFNARTGCLMDYVEGDNSHVNPIKTCKVISHVTTIMVAAVLITALLTVKYLIRFSTLKSAII